MKRKIFSVFFALVLVVTLGLLTAVPTPVAAQGSEPSMGIKKIDDFGTTGLMGGFTYAPAGEEIRYLTVCEVDGNVVAWYEDREGTKTIRRVDLTAGETAGTAVTFGAGEHPGDVGLNWHPRVFPVPAGLDFEGGLGMYAGEVPHVGTGNSSHFYTSTDGGKTWTLQGETTYWTGARGSGVAGVVRRSSDNRLLVYWETGDKGFHTSQTTDAALETADVLDDYLQLEWVGTFGTFNMFGASMAVAELSDGSFVMMGSTPKADRRHISLLYSANGLTDWTLVETPKFTDTPATMNAEMDWYQTSPDKFRLFRDDGVIGDGIQEFEVAFGSPSKVGVDDNWSSQADVLDLMWGYNAFATIQAGVTAVAEGGTVNVAEGTYNENVYIEKALTVKSTDGPEETIIDGDTCYVVWVRHSDVTFEGFTVTNPDIKVSDPNGILVSDPTGGWPKDATIVNNVYVLNNIVKAVGASTVYGATGINIGPSSDVVISGNIIKNIKDIIEPEETTHGPCGINVWGTAEVDMPFNIEISNNEISGIYNGIHLEYASGVQIEGNSITECETGIKVEPGPFEWCTVSDLTVNFNNIAGNTEYGVANFDLALSVDAENNWWGDASGPFNATSNPDGEGNAVSNNVAFEPWLKAWPITPMSSFVIDHAKIDFGNPDTGKVSLKGTLQLDPAGDGVDILEDDVIVTVGPLSETITMELKGKKGEKWEYKRPEGGEGIIKHMTIKWENGNGDFHVSMDGADLSGLTDPDEVTMSVLIGDDYGWETIQMTEKKRWDYKAPSP